MSDSLVKQVSTDNWNATVVNHRFVVGGGITGQPEMEWLEAQGVLAVVSLAAELDDAALAVPDHVGFLHIAWQDDGQPKPLEDFVELLEYVVGIDFDLYPENHQLPLYYLHCAAGVNRGPLACCFLLAAVSGLSAEEAWQAIKAVRPQVGGYDIPAYKQSLDAALAAVRGGQGNG